VHRFGVERRGKSVIATAEDISKHQNLEKTLNAVTSGFYNIQDTKWINEDEINPNFCVLQLHGSICYFADEAAGYDTLFDATPVERAKKLFKKSTEGILPPVLFPWEIMTDKGFTEKSAFPQYPNLYPLFRGIWERAKREVQAANKISFVGLSMHPFLMDGLKYLFENKAGNIEVCVANPDNPKWIQGKRETYWINQPHCSAYDIDQMLKGCAPHFVKMGWHEVELETGLITFANDFESFVKTQMKPIVMK
jgi:hypothetical protein